MKRKEISKLVLKISDGIFSTLTDLVLWNIFYFIEVSLSGSPGKIGRAEISAREDLQKFNSETIKEAIKRARKRGFIKGDFVLTKEGKERLESFLPRYLGERKWNGNWYLVIYDIPQSLNRYRDILRENLKRLGFGQLQASVWVSPFNFFGEVEEKVKDYNLSPYVIFAITDKLGRKEAKVLTERVWHLEKINNLYKTLLNKFEKSKEEELYFEYLNIIDKDPQLPKELLPEDWRGGEVHEVFSKLNSKFRKI